MVWTTTVLTTPAAAACGASSMIENTRRRPASASSLSSHGCACAAGSQTCWWESTIGTSTGKPLTGAGTESVAKVVELPVEIAARTLIQLARGASLGVGRGLGRCLLGRCWLAACRPSDGRSWGHSCRGRPRCGGLLAGCARAAVTEEPAADHACDQPAYVGLPADASVRQQHGELVGEAQRHDGADQDVDAVAVEETPDQDVAQIAEDHSAGADAVRVRVAKEPGGEPADDDDHGGQPEEADNAAVSRQEPEDEERAGVALDVRPADVQERRRHDIRQAGQLARPDPVIVGELIVIKRVGNLDYPENGQESDHDEERFARLGQHRFGV